ncbi:MAG: LamG domain-containing protein [Victivallaceae bacterium]|nr:LamG domain-containing protein [Victivallaceae bacterium]
MGKILSYVLLLCLTGLVNPTGTAEEKNLLGYWPMNEGKGEILKDLSGNENNGQIHDAAWTSIAKNRFVLDLNRFEGSTDYVDCGRKRVLNPVQAITIEAWLYVRSNHTGYFILKKNAYGVKFSKGRINFVLFMNRGKAIKSLTSPCFPENEWHHLVCTYDRKTMKIYVDGKEQNKADAQYSIDSSPAPLLLGCSQGWHDINYFDGRISELKLYGAALTAEQIREQYKRLAPDYLSKDLKKAVSSAPAPAATSKIYKNISDEERENWLGKISPVKTDRPQPAVEIKSPEKIPTIFVDGVPRGPMLYTGPYPFTYPINSKYINKLAANGIHVHFLPVGVLCPLKKKSPAFIINKYWIL